MDIPALPCFRERVIEVYYSSVSIFPLWKSRSLSKSETFYFGDPQVSRRGFGSDHLASMTQRRIGSP